MASGFSEQELGDIRAQFDQVSGEAARKNLSLFDVVLIQMGNCTAVLPLA